MSAACTDPRYGEALASYMLGACPPEESAGVERHLGECAACSAEHERLRSARELLLTQVPQVTPDPRVKASVMREVRGQAELFRAARQDPDPAPRRRFRLPSLGIPPALAAVLACGVLAFGVALGIAGGRWAGESTVLAAKVDRRAAPDGRASLELGSGPARLVVENMPSPGRGRVYQVWLHRRGHDPEPTRSMFTVGSRGAGEVTVPGGVADHDALLVTSEPAGGSRAPSRPPVLSVAV
jgi:anti-sigma factor RsiW